MFDRIKRMKVNVKNENYKVKYDCEENENVQNNKVEKFYCDFEGDKHAYQHKKFLLEHYKSHFAGELTCKNGLNHHND